MGALDLQFDEALRPVLGDLVAEHGRGAAPLEARSERAHRALLQHLARWERTAAPRHRRWLLRLDRALRTDAPEHLDDPDFPEERKLALVRALHLFNRAVGAYDRFWRLLRPWLEQAAQRAGGPPRLLELACGAGHFSLEVARRAARASVPLEVVATDIVEAQVLHGRRAARTAGLDVTFEVLDATDADALLAMRPDVVFVAQSLHHFGPGLLSRILGAAAGGASTAVIAVDGRRALSKLLLVPGPTWLLPWTPHFHDAWLSARKFYSEPELELLARLAAPEARVTVAADGPYSVLTIQPRS